MVVVRKAYAYDRDENSTRHSVVAYSVSRLVPQGVELLEDSEDKAIQSAREECDINTLVRRFGLTGQMPSDVRAPTFGDFTNVLDYRGAQDALIAARESFMAMPAHVRARFGHDPAEFVAFCSDEKNLEEMRKLGLALPKKEEPTPAPAPPPAAPPPA